MNTIKELQDTVNAGECAQESLNRIAETIYDTYLEELKFQQEKLAKEFPSYAFGDHEISPLQRNLNRGFYSYRIIGDNLILTGQDYFRGETDYESDTLPASFFIDDENERVRLITAFVSEKIISVRNRLKEKAEQEEAEEKRQYEYLKEKFKS